MLPSCCGKCDECPPHSLTIVLSRDTANGFTQAEIDSLYLLKFNTETGLLSDSARTQGNFVLSVPPQEPYARFIYEIHKGKADTTPFRIRQVKATLIAMEGCCSCGDYKGMSFELDSVTKTVSYNDPFTLNKK